MIWVLLPVAAALRLRGAGGVVVSRIVDGGDKRMPGMGIVESTTPELLSSQVLAFPPVVAGISQRTDRLSPPLAPPCFSSAMT